MRRESAGGVDPCDSSRSCHSSSGDAPAPCLVHSFGVIISAYRSLLLQLNNQRECKTQGSRANRKVKEPCRAKCSEITWSEMILGQEDKTEQRDDGLCLELGLWRTRGTAESPDRFLGFGVRMRLAGVPAQGTSGPRLPSVAFPICRDGLGEGMRKMKKSLVFPFT